MDRVFGLLERVVENRRVYDAVIIFYGASLVQWVTPWPLDNILLPATVAYWYVQSDQSNSVMDYTYDKLNTLIHSISTKPITKEPATVAEKVVDDE